MKLKIWFRALRARFLTVTLTPVLIGTAVAWYAAGSFDLLRFILTLLGAVLIHLGANMSNDYFDYRSETDALNAWTSVHSGGSRVIQEGLIPARQILLAAIACLVVGSLIGIWLVIALRSMLLLVIGILGVFFAYFYTATPLRLGYHGLAEIMTGVSFGPFIVLGAFAAQAPAWSTTAFLASIPVGLLLAAILMINEFPDHDSDRAVGKRTMAVILGRPRALVIYHLTMLAAFLWVPVCAIAGLFPPWTLLSLASFPFALKAFTVSRAHFEDAAKIVGANMSTFLLHLSFTLLLALGFLLG